MSKFNLKNYKKTNGDEHISRMLKEQHSDAPNVITEKQLQKNHVSEKDQITEKQLESNRREETPMTLEGRLNSAKSRFDIKHRNSKTSSGDINKIEEKRLSKNKIEDEKYESASSVPSVERWWEKHKKEDKLKVASLLGQMKKLAQIPPEPEDNEEIEERDVATKSLTNDKSRFDRLQNMWSSMEDGVSNDTGGDTGNEFIGSPSKDAISEEEEEDIELGASKDLFLADKRENMPKGLNPYTYYASVGFDPTGWKDTDELENAVLDMVLKIRPDLDGKISNEDLSKPKYFGDRGYYAVRLIGEEFMPPSETTENKNEFQEISFETTDVGGTPTHFGKVKIPGDEAEIDDETIAQDIADFVNDLHQDLNVSPDSITIDEKNMEATFVIAASGEQGEIDRMPSEGGLSEGGLENFPVEEISSPNIETTEETDMPPPVTTAKSKFITKTSITKKK